MAKKREKKKEKKEVELRKRIEKLEKRVDQMDTSSYRYLINNVERLANEVDQHLYTISLQQQFLTEKGLEKEYKEWLKKELDKKQAASKPPKPKKKPTKKKPTKKTKEESSGKGKPSDSKSPK